MLTYTRLMITELVKQEIALTIIEPALFYHWMRVAMLNRGWREAEIEHWEGQMEEVMIGLVAWLRKCVERLRDGGATPAMRKLGQGIEEVKRRLSALNSQAPSSEEEEYRQAYVTMRTLMHTVQKFIDERVDTGLIVTYYIEVDRRSERHNF